jgi:hypothetical protein
MSKITEIMKSQGLSYTQAVKRLESLSPSDTTACSVIFAVSNDGGKTGVAWRDDVHEALAYLDLQNAGGRTDYCVVAVRKSPQNK